jgi:UTP-glucose-1-phosphate uridylyltransferase
MQHEAVYAYQYSGKRYDCGSKEGFLQATVELALQHPEVGASFRATDPGHLTALCPVTMNKRPAVAGLL